MCKSYKDVVLSKLPRPPAHVERRPRAPLLQWALSISLQVHLYVIPCSEVAQKLPKRCSKTVWVGAARPNPANLCEAAQA